MYSAVESARASIRMCADFASVDDQVMRQSHNVANLPWVHSGTVMPHSASRMWTSRGFQRRGKQAAVRGLREGAKTAARFRTGTAGWRDHLRFREVVRRWWSRR
jgi:hypothetical protein